MALGVLMFSFWGALLFGAGLLALVALGGAVLLLGLGMQAAAPHLETFNTFITGLAEKMAIIEPNIESIRLLGDALMALVWPLIYLGISGAIFTEPLIALSIAGERLAVGFTGFTDAMAGVPEMLVKLSEINTLGIWSLAGSLYGLAGAMAFLGVSGLLALPVIKGLQLIGLLGGGEEEAADSGESDIDQLDEIRQAVSHMSQRMDDLVNGFTEGTYPTAIGVAVGDYKGVTKEVSIKGSIV